MRLPKNILSGNYTKPRIFLCDTNKEKICQLDTSNTKASIKFNAYSELTFEVGRTCNDLIDGTTKVNPFYDKIENPRLILLENFGYFEIQGPELISDGIKEVKNITAYSFEYTLSTKFLKDFYINTGRVDSLEVLNAANANSISPITLYNPNKPKLSLLHLVLEDVYGWSIGHVDSSLKTLSRQFEVDRESVYDFLMNEVCERFNCYIIFDTFDNTINIYAESLTSKFIGDGKTDTFVISPPFSEIGTVSVDGYKVSNLNYDYTAATGKLVFKNSVPASGAHIEVVDGALTKWETDVFVTFDNLAQEVNVSYDSDAIKTKLVVTYGDNLDIREANLGLPYLTDLSYYYTVDWMGEDLYNAYTTYLQKSNGYQSQYTANSQAMLEIANKISFEEHRLSLEYAKASVDGNTVGAYYVKVGTSPNHYYKEVTLPADYVAGTTYYSDETTNLQDSKDGNVRKLYEALQKYFMDEQGWKDELDGLAGVFGFMESNTISQLSSKLNAVTSKKTKNKNVNTAINNFLNEMWDQVGRTPLKSLYHEQYKTIQVTNIEAGYSQEDHKNYGLYYPVVLYLDSIDSAIAKRDSVISAYNDEYKVFQDANSTIADDLLMGNNFNDDQLMRLNAFIREDELHLSDFVETDLTTIGESFTLKQDAMESGRIELQKICQPQLQFSMSMANIYALSEFDSIIHQFQVGNVIKVGLRPDYIKQSRLLQVNIGLDDLSDFSCEFGELTNLRTQSDIHADLLSQAVSAGKSVATNSSYWTKGSDQANSIDLRLQEGLLNSIEALKATDGTQNAYIDKYGIHLETLSENGEVSDKRIWMVNNQIVFTDDGFKTSKSALGEFTVDGETQWGLLAQAVIAGYIQGSKIEGGTINIGDGNFVVDEYGNVTMNATNNIDGVTDKIDDIQDIITDVKESKIYRVEVSVSGKTIMTNSNDNATLTCKVFSWDSDITNQLLDNKNTTEIEGTMFYWKRDSGNAAQDDIWNRRPEHQGYGINTCLITTEDVLENSSFYCEVELSGTTRASNAIAFSEQKKIVAINEYYLATSKSGGVTTTTTGWAKNSVPSLTSTKKYLWNYEEVVYSIGDPSVTDPVIIGYYGQGSAGVGISSITNYYQITTTLSVPSLPEEGKENNWSKKKNTAQSLTPTNKYLWNYESIIYTDGKVVNTDPALIGVYGDSGANAIMFEIYSADGFIFKENSKQIKLQIASYDGENEITKNAKYTWSWWDQSENDGKGAYSVITETTKKSFTVDKSSEYAFANLKCTMTYNGKTYEDYVTLTNEAIVYTPVVKFFNDSNILQAEDKCLVAYVELYRNNELVEGISTDRYYYSDNNSVSYESWKDTSFVDSTTNAITMKATEVRNGRQYRCKITDKNGNEICSQPATLHVTNDLSLAFTSHPSSAQATLGTMVSFSVNAVGKNIKYQWQYRTSSTSSWQESSATGCNTNTMKVEATEARNGLQWRCSVLDSYGNIIYSSPATLEIVSSKPMITSHPSDTTMLVGEQASFSVSASGSSLTYQWQYRDKRVKTDIPGSFDVGDRTYFVYKDSDDGLYKAVLAEYTSSNTWDVIDEVLQYTHANTYEPNVWSNIIVIDKEKVNKSRGISFAAYKESKCISNAYVTVVDANDPVISKKAPANPVNGQLWLDTSKSPNVLKIYTVDTNGNGEWVAGNQLNGGAIYTSKPKSYAKGDLWILGKNESCQEFGPGTMLKAIVARNVNDENKSDADWIDADEEMTNVKKNISQCFSFNQKTGLKIKQSDNQFYVNIDSQKMGFYDNNSTNPIVEIGNSSANIRNATFDGDKTTVNSDATFNGGAKFTNHIDVHGSSNGFVFKVESNGSLSLALSN